MTINRVVFVYLTCVVFSCTNQNISDNSNEPLYLTPYIEEGRIEEALQKAKVQVQNFTNIESYSGFINVNQSFKSEMFFWYFPSETTPRDAPLILWLQGGPGMSGLFGLFVENGPFLFKNGHIEKRSLSWNKEYNMLYVDSPVGTGYSHTLEGGYSTDVLHVANNLHNFLIQFFKLFSDIKNNDFYLAGESYAGKYISVLAHVIHNRNKPDLSINLKGMAIGNGFIDPINQISFGKYFYSFGLIDKDGIKHFDLLERECVEHIKNKQWLEARKSLYKIMCGSYEFHLQSLLYNLTGFMNCHFIVSGSPMNYNFMEVTFNKEFRKVVHVGDTKFSGEQIEEYLKNDLVQSVSDYIVENLNNYKVIFYAGQLDVIVPYPSIRNVINHLNFSSADEWSNSNLQVWKVDNQVAGLFKSVGNLTEILVYNAGHSAIIEQPERVYQIVKSLTTNAPLEIFVEQ